MSPSVHSQTVTNSLVQFVHYTMNRPDAMCKGMKRCEISASQRVMAGLNEEVAISFILAGHTKLGAHWGFVLAGVNY